MYQARSKILGEQKNAAFGHKEGKGQQMSLTSAEIGNFGERHATAWLQSKGYQCYRNTQQPGSTDIEARGTSKSLLVQVKTGLFPSSAPSLASDEQRNISSRATRLGYEAWLAQAQINAMGSLMGEIKWTKLN